MNRKNFFFLFLIIATVFFIVSCTLQEKPDFTGLSSTTASTLSEDLTSLTNEPANTATESTEAANSGFDIENLKLLENKFIVKDAFPGLAFNSPLDLQNAGDGTGRIFVAEQSGRIFVITGKADKKAEEFLDINERIDDSGNEEGLLGLAFHPDFKNNGWFFVNYTGANSTNISRFNVYRDNPDLADPDSEEIILTFSQPFSNHNGGKLAFNPDDGFLYISAGDGGGAGDPQGNGQNLKTLLGKILRIDIDNKDTGLNYSIPPDNPFKGNTEGYREEIYAYGLRNPWRFSFDSATGLLWAADVGQNKIEEIDIIQKGKNYGWSIMEGSFCYDPPSGCNAEGLELPVYEYQHPLGKSITGGYVYHGELLPVLNGAYVYADFVSGYIWALAYSDNQNVQNFTLAKTDLNISSFGVDEKQELYFTSFDGKIYQLGMPE
ncbi:MAG: PQQ-dependent sugar dehydrogenase [Candidatus Humimicrobiaceae bacterium]